MPATHIRSLVIDTDTASDDAVALIIAARHPDARIRAVTIAPGNVPIETGTRNAFAALDAAGAPPVPVHVGRASPLLHPLETAQEVHGIDGVGGVPLPATQRAAEDEPAVQALLRIARDEPGEHELVTLGPLTNIAAALLQDTELLTRFRRTTMMLGASDCRGNVTPTAEFNAWADAHAAQIVLAAPGAKTIVGWDVSRLFAVFTEDDDDELRAAGALGRFVVDINADVRTWGLEVTGIGGYDLPDPAAMAVALAPEIVTASENRHVTVSLDLQTRGQLIIDHRARSAPANADIVTAIDRDRFVRMLHDAVDEGTGAHE